MRLVIFILGICCVLLGGLWLLQGLGAIRVQPILCVADCTPVEGPSLAWAAIGLAAVAIGATAVDYGRRRRG